MPGLLNTPPRHVAQRRGAVAAVAVAVTGGGGVGGGRGKRGRGGDGTWHGEVR